MYCLFTVTIMSHNECKLDMSSSDSQKMLSDAKKGKHKKGTNLANMGIHIQARGGKKDQQEYTV